MKLPTAEQLQAYLRAELADLERPDWDVDGGILEICETPVAEAYRALALWDTDDMPTLDEVVGNAMATDYLIFADAEDKEKIFDWVSKNYDLPTA